MYLTYLNLPGGGGGGGWRLRTDDCFPGWFFWTSPLLLDCRDSCPGDTWGRAGDTSSWSPGRWTSWGCPAARTARYRTYNTSRWYRMPVLLNFHQCCEPELLLVNWPRKTTGISFFFVAACKTHKLRQFNNDQVHRGLQAYSLKIGNPKNLK